MRKLLFAFYLLLGLLGAARAQSITSLPQGSAVTSSDIFYDVQGGTIGNATAGTSTAITAAQLKAYLLGGGSIDVLSGKTATFDNTLTFAGTDGATVNFGAGGTVVFVQANALPFADLSGTPTTLSGYGITDAESASAAASTYVAKTTTVNGHALSANVTVSASDINTGTTAVSVGGTGLNTIPVGDFVLGNGTGAMTYFAPGSGVTTAMAGAANGYGHLRLSHTYDAVADWGMVPDGKVVTDGVITASSGTLTSATAAWTSANVGQGITVYQGSGTLNMSGTTTGSSTTVTVASTAGIAPGDSVSQGTAVTTTGSFTQNSNTFTVTSASGFAVHTILRGACIDQTHVVTVTGVSGTTITMSQVATQTNPSANVVCYENILPSGETVLSITDSTHFVLTTAPTDGATATLYFQPTWKYGTITSYTSATQVGTSFTNLISATGCRVRYGTDNTTAYQNAITGSYAQGYANTLFIPKGRYYFGGALQETSNRNAVILLPNSTTPFSALTIVGENEPPLESNGFLGAYDNSQGVAEFFCPTAGSGTNPAFMGGNVSTSPGSLSGVTVHFRNVVYTTPFGNNLGFVNDLNGGTCIASYCEIVGDGLTSMNIQNVVPPLMTNTPAVVLPNYNNGDFSSIDHCFIGNFGVGVQASTHAHIEDCLIGGNSVNIQWDPPGGMITVLNCHLIDSTYQYYANTGSCYLQVFGGEMEDGQGGPGSVLWDFYSPSTSPIQGFVATDNLIGYPIQSNTLSTLRIDDNSHVYQGTSYPFVGQVSLRAQSDATSAYYGITNVGGTELFDMIANSIFDQDTLQARNGFTLFLNGTGGSGISIAPSTDAVTVTGPSLTTPALIMPTSGSNVKGGTFTLSSGSVTVSNTSVTSSSVVHLTVKTVIGTRAGLPDIVPNAGTGFTATGASSDNSTYNYWIEN